MPTGYTSCIYDNKNTTFREFVLNCANAFYRNLEKVGKNPSEFKPIEPNIKYYVDKLKSAKSYKSPTRAQFDDYVKRTLQEIDKNVNDRKSLKVRYNNMVKLVKNWTPPTEEHVPLKKFMLEQLEVSMGFDCSDIDYITIGQINSIKALTYDEYVKKCDDENIHNIKYYTDQIKEEKTRVKKLNTWIQKLFKSLK